MGERLPLLGNRSKEDLVVVCLHGHSVFVRAHESVVDQGRQRPGQVLPRIRVANRRLLHRSVFNLDQDPHGVDLTAFVTEDVD